MRTIQGLLLSSVLALAPTAAVAQAPCERVAQARGCAVQCNPTQATKVVRISAGCCQAAATTQAQAPSGCCTMPAQAPSGCCKRMAQAPSGCCKKMAQAPSGCCKKMAQAPCCGKCGNSVAETKAPVRCCVIVCLPKAPTRQQNGKNACCAVKIVTRAAAHCGSCCQPAQQPACCRSAAAAPACRAKPTQVCCAAPAKATQTTTVRVPAQTVETKCVECPQIKVKTQTQPAKTDSKPPCCPKRTKKVRILL